VCKKFICQKCEDKHIETCPQNYIDICTRCNKNKYEIICDDCDEKYCKVCYENHINKNECGDYFDDNHQIYSYLKSNASNGCYKCVEDSNFANK
jgi:hypothetical protein